ncbi:MAG: CtsR family transcriptional regulator [Clostridia bacterium]|nr:CtsR family transcriptional regulator [Eubacteriales bacterium]MDD4461758.1 CtsR family transcriptional regulator [Eubacteriales bacterium]NCC48723.1 CtsR family transcriptional regulator [Clostridia bacterium]
MARISDLVEQMIKQMIDQNQGSIEITRSELAEQMNCVPSQITYVLATRFANHQGYLVESRRGGGGWIRIRRIRQASPSQYLLHALNHIGEQLSQHQAEILIRNFLDYEIVGERDTKLLTAAVSDHSLSDLPADLKDRTRMTILKNMLTSLMVGQE